MHVHLEFFCTFTIFKEGSNISRVIALTTKILVLVSFALFIVECVLNPKTGIK